MYNNWGKFNYYYISSIFNGYIMGYNTVDISNYTIEKENFG